MTEKHETTVVDIRGDQVEVDKLIAPLISCLNSIDGITTRYSCCGDIHNGVGTPPYITLSCHPSMVSKLFSIVNEFSYRHSFEGDIRIEFFDQLYGRRKYADSDFNMINIYFPNRYTMTRFSKWFVKKVKSGFPNVYIPRIPDPSRMDGLKTDFFNAALSIDKKKNGEEYSLINDPDLIESLKASGSTKQELLEIQSTKPKKEQKIDKAG